jgi:hypothetical protein
MDRQGMKRPVCAFRGFLSVIFLIIFHFSASAEEWVFYAGTFQSPVPDSTRREWYSLNRLSPLPEGKANVLHYFDQDSVAYNSPFPGGKVKVWEKSVYQKETKSYEEIKAEIEKEEEKRLNRKITVLDYGRLFPMAVNRATKEVTTLLEIDCSGKEFFIIEVNTYDKTGDRLSREIIPDEYLWSPVGSNSIMEVLAQKICR